MSVTEYAAASTDKTDVPTILSVNVRRGVVTLDEDVTGVWVL